MKKKSKKRIPQDILPWKRVKVENENEFILHQKPKTRWTVGNRRALEMSNLFAQNRIEFSKILLRTFWEDINARHSSYSWPEWKGTKKWKWVNSEQRIKLGRGLKTKFEKKLSQIYAWQLSAKLAKLDRKSFDYRLKNTCLFLGKGRTFNRQLFMSRHTMRKLTQVGLISGLKRS